MLDRKFRLARIWSNNELKKFGQYFKGNIINVSGGDDFDKEKDFYADYFPNKNSYCISNYKQDRFRGYKGNLNEISIDLTKPIDHDLINKYDVVFNHTTLEHIFEVEIAVENLCKLSNDIVIIVVPFSQVFHDSDYFSDYWRFSPSAIENLFKKNGVDLIYCSCNNDFNSAIYLFCIGTKNKFKWDNYIPFIIQKPGNIIGGKASFQDVASTFLQTIGNGFKKIKRKI